MILNDLIKTTIIYKEGLFDFIFIIYQDLINFLIRKIDFVYPKTQCRVNKFC